jgi:hypothetical protein
MVFWNWNSDTIIRIMNSGKLLKISDERSIFIIQNEDDSYIAKDNTISYKNIGESFDIRIINESYVNIDAKNNAHVLDASGNSKFHFPLMWLDTLSMKLYELQDSGLIKIE